MRIAAFLFALSLFTTSLFLRGSSAQHALTPSQDLAPLHQNFPQASGDGVRMLRQAEIRVMPADLAAANRAELASLRERVMQAEIIATRVEVSDPAVREQLSRQLQLAKALLRYAERQDSEDGKSPMVLQVEHRLNKIQARMMCEACHGGSFNNNGIGE
jgi:hypothetical protein